LSNCKIRKSRSVIFDYESNFRTPYKAVKQPPGGTTFKQFIAEFGDELMIEEPRYVFHSLGVTLVVVDKLFDAILIDIDTPSTRQGIICRYEGDLPNAIDSNDASEVVEKKLGIRPFSSQRPSITGVRHNYFEDSYKLPPLVLVFAFTTNPERLASVAIASLVNLPEFES